jgi:hypothetical protein
MLGKATIDIFEKGFLALGNDLKKEKSKTIQVTKRIAAYPFKVLASFLAAPFLVFKIALIVKNPIRRTIAIIGLLISIILSYVAATFLGSLVGALFIFTHVGVLAGIGFLLGTTISIYLSVIFSIIVLNSVSFIFLKISSQEVIDYLQEIST